MDAAGNRCRYADEDRVTSGDFTWLDTPMVRWWVRDGGSHDVIRVVADVCLGGRRDQVGLDAWGEGGANRLLGGANRVCDCVRRRDGAFRVRDRRPQTVRVVVRGARATRQHLGLRHRATVDASVAARRRGGRVARASPSPALVGSDAVRGGARRPWSTRAISGDVDADAMVGGVLCGGDRALSVEQARWGLYVSRAAPRRARARDSLTPPRRPA